MCVHVCVCVRVPLLLWCPRETNSNTVFCVFRGEGVPYKKKRHAQKVNRTHPQQSSSKPTNASGPFSSVWETELVRVMTTNDDLAGFNEPGPTWRGRLVFCWIGQHKQNQKPLPGGHPILTQTSTHTEFPCAQSVGLQS